MSNAISDQPRQRKNNQKQKPHVWVPLFTIFAFLYLFSAETVVRAGCERVVRARCWACSSVMSPLLSSEMGPQKTGFCSGHSRPLGAFGHEKLEITVAWLLYSLIVL